MRVEELEQRIFEYEKGFEEIKAMQPSNERTDKLKQLYEQYNGDGYVLELARKYSFIREVKSLERLVDIKSNISKEIVDEDIKRLGLEGRKKDHYIFENIAKSFKDPLDLIYINAGAAESRRIHGTLTWEELHEPFTI